MTKQFEITDTVAWINDDALTVNWGSTIGFGQFVFTYDAERDKIICNNETMSPEFVAEVLRHMAQNMVMADDVSTEKHVETLGVEDLNQLILPTTCGRNVDGSCWFEEPFYETMDETTIHLRFKLGDDNVVAVSYYHHNQDVIAISDDVALNGWNANRLVFAERWTW